MAALRVNIVVSFEVQDDDNILSLSRPRSLSGNNLPAVREADSVFGLAENVSRHLVTILSLRHGRTSGWLVVAAGTEPPEACALTKRHPGHARIVTDQPETTDAHSS
jgi:hypothetical protein